MTDALERLREHAFETRNPKAAKPLVRAGTFVKVGVRGGTILVSRRSSLVSNPAKVITRVD